MKCIKHFIKVFQTRVCEGADGGGGGEFKEKLIIN